jgi:hypothetical protein
VEVEYPENEELEPELCATIADRLSKKLEAYPNLKVHGVIPEFINEDQGKFQIHFLCS